MEKQMHGSSHHMSMKAHERSMGRGEYESEEPTHEGMYDAKIGNAFKDEMMSIAFGQGGKKDYDADAKKIAPYMMYNDNADQNGY